MSELPAQLQELLDREAIRDLLTRYTRAVDTGDFEALREVFTPDATLDYTSAGGAITGVDEAIAFVAQLALFERWQHLLGQVEFDFMDADHCNVLAYFLNPMVAKRTLGDEHVIQVGGYYHHRLVRTSDGWRSSYLRDELIWTR